MCYRKVGKMPDQVGTSESFSRSLHGAGKVEDDTYQEEGKCIAILDFVPRPFEGHNKVGRARNDRNNHTCTTHCMSSS